MSENLSVADMERKTSEFQSLLRTRTDSIANTRQISEGHASRILDAIESIDKLNDPKLRYETSKQMNDFYMASVNDYDKGKSWEDIDLASEFENIAKKSVENYEKSIENLPSDYTERTEPTYTMDEMYDAMAQDTVAYAEQLEEEARLSDEITPTLLADGKYSYTNENGEVIVSDDFKQMLEEIGSDQNVGAECVKALLGSMATTEELKEFKAALDEAKENGCPQEEFEKIENDFNQINEFYDADAGVPQKTRKEITDLLKDANKQAKEGKEINWEDISQETRKTLENGQKLDEIEGQNEKELFKKNSKMSNLSGKTQAFLRGGMSMLKGLTSDDPVQAMLGLASAVTEIVIALAAIKKQSAKEAAEVLKNIVPDKVTIKTQVFQNVKEIKPEELQKSQADLSEALKRLKQHSLKTGEQYELTERLLNGELNIQFKPTRMSNGARNVECFINGQKSTPEEIAQKVMQSRENELQKSGKEIESALTKGKQVSKSVDKASNIAKTNPATSLITAAKNIIEGNTQTHEEQSR